MSKIACVCNTDPRKSLVRLPRILLYCSRWVTVAFVYVPRWSSTRNQLAVFPPPRRIDPYESRVAHAGFVSHARGELGSAMKWPFELS